MEATRGIGLPLAQPGRRIGAVAGRTVLFRDEIDLAATEAAHPYLVSAGAQVMINRVFEQLADAARAVTDDRIAQPEVTKVEFVIHLEQAASANVVARHLINETGFLAGMVTSSIWISLKR